MELFENADVTASIYDASEHAHGSLGSRTQRQFDHLISLIEVRRTKLNVAASSCRRGFFEKVPPVDADIFYTNKKDLFSKISGYVWTRP